MYNKYKYNKYASYQRYPHSLSASDGNHELSGRLSVHSARPVVPSQLQGITTFDQYKFVLITDQRHLCERLV